MLQAGADFALEIDNDAVLVRRGFLGRDGRGNQEDRDNREDRKAAAVWENASSLADGASCFLKIACNNHTRGSS